jgi:hypothetical protein
VSAMTATTALLLQQMPAPLQSQSSLLRSESSAESRQPLERTEQQYLMPMPQNRLLPLWTQWRTPQHRLQTCLRLKSQQQLTFLQLYPQRSHRCALLLHCTVLLSISRTVVKHLEQCSNAECQLLAGTGVQSSWQGGWVLSVDTDRSCCGRSIWRCLCSSQAFPRPAPRPTTG